MDDDEADGKQSSTGGGASTSSTAAGEGKNKKREGQRISNQGRSAHGARESAQGENNEDDTVDDDDDDDDDDDEKKEKEPEADEYTKLVLSMLTQRGVQALKVGRNGPARKTRVTLSADGWYLCWKSRVKRRKLARVKLDQVTRIMR